MSDAQVLLVLVTLALMLVGVAGVVLPVLPDVWLIWLAALGYGLLSGFSGWVDWLVMLLLTALMALGVVVDLALGPAAAKKGGASWQALVASLVLGLLGMALLPPFGMLLGALLGLFGVEYLRRGQNAREAWTAVRGYLMGCGLSVVLRLVIALVMIALWGVWVVWGK